MAKHSKDPKSKELLALSEEVGRVAETLAQLALGSGPAEAAGSPGGPNDPPLEAVAKLIQARRERCRYLSPDLLGEPAWDMLLQVLHQEMSLCRVSASRLVEVAGVPRPVARRWLDALVQRRMILVSNDAVGEEIVELVPEVSAALRRYFSEVVRG